MSNTPAPVWLAMMMPQPPGLWLASLFCTVMCEVAPRSSARVIPPPVLNSVMLPSALDDVDPLKLIPVLPLLSDVLPRMLAPVAATRMPSPVAFSTVRSSTVTFGATTLTPFSLPVASMIAVPCVCAWSVSGLRTTASSV